MRVFYTPELVAHIRHRYESTDDTLEAIARDTGVSERSINRMRDREAWPRRSERSPRGLPAAMRLLETANGLLAGRAATGGAGATAEPAPAQAIERIARLLEEQLAAEEAYRATLGSQPRPPAEAAQAARTLAILTQTLHALQRMRCGLAPDFPDDDDMPEDIDEFRRDLARRIDAFVASRTDAGDAECDPAAATVVAAR